MSLIRLEWVWFRLTFICRLNRIFLNYGYIVKFGAPSRNMFKTSRGLFYARAFPLQRVSNEFPKTRIFDEVARLSSFASESSFYKSHLTYDFEEIPINQLILANNTSINTTEYRIPTVSDSLYLTETPNEPASKATPNTSDNKKETAVNFQLTLSNFISTDWA